MALSFDPLTYSIRLRMNGVPCEQADAHAMVARDLIVADTVFKVELDSKIVELRADMDRDRGNLEHKIDSIVTQVTRSLALAMFAGFTVMTSILAIALK